MRRRIFDFVVLLLFVWACMLVGLWAINTIIVPMELPGSKNGSLTNIIQVAISTILVLAWLQAWRWLARAMFWRALRQGDNIKRESQNNVGGER